MRVFERLRGRSRSKSDIERKPNLETVLADLVCRMDDETPVIVAPENKSACCSCCSADGETMR